MPKPFNPALAKESRRKKARHSMPTLETVAALAEPVNTREPLAAYWNTRITVEAVFQRYGFTRHARKVVVVNQVTHEGELVADHVWIPLGKALRSLHLKAGNLIQFEARVIRYVKDNPHIFFYGLDDIAAPIVLRRK